MTRRPRNRRIEEQRARHADEHFDDFGKERVLERVLEREREVGVLKDAGPLGHDLGVGLDQQVVLELFLHLRAVVELPQGVRRVRRSREHLPFLPVTLDDPVQVLHQRGRVEGSVAVVVHLQERDVLPGDVHDRLETLPGGLGRDRPLLAPGGEVARLLLALERRDFEIVGEDLVRVDFRVVVQADELPLRAAGLRVEEAQSHRHQERVGDEDPQVEHRRQHEQVPQGGLALEQRDAARRPGGGRRLDAQPRRD